MPSTTRSRVHHPSGSRRRSVAFSVHSVTDQDLQDQERAEEQEQEQEQDQDQDQIYRQASHEYPLQGSTSSSYGRRRPRCVSFSSKSRSPQSSSSLLKKKTIKFDEARVSTATKIGLWMMGTCVDKMDKAQKAERIKRKAEREEVKKADNNKGER